MKQESSLWAPSPQVGSEDVLRLLDESHRLLSAILLGVIMQMRSLELERCRLLGARDRKSVVWERVSSPV